MKDKSVTISSSYKKQLSNTYNMSILMRLDGLSFSVLDPVSNNIVAIGNYEFGEFDEQFAKHEETLLLNDIFKSKFKKVSVCIESRTFSIMPKSLYAPQHSADVLKFIGGNPGKDDKILSSDIPMANAMLIYTVPNFLYYFLQTQYTDVRVLHHTEPIIQASLLKREAEKKKQMMHVEFSNDGITLVATDHNVLKLCNKFKFKDATDIVYIIMYTMDQIGFSNDQTSIVLTGDFNANDGRVELIKRFGRNVSVSKLPNYFGYDAKPADQEHKYVTLLNQHLCE